MRWDVVAPAGAALLLAAALAAADPVGAQGGRIVTDSYAFVGYTQVFVVPAGVDEVTVVACGAEGGRAGDFDGAGGGLGGRATATLAVRQDEILTVMVGSAGGDDGEGGFNGGGTSRNETATLPGVSYGRTGGGGGGASDVRRVGGGLSDRVVIGGGGGGGGAQAALETRVGTGVSGGSGGGTDGGAGSDERAGGFGGTSTSGGPGSEAWFYATGHDGKLGYGGDSDLSGAGGGGLYGGGGGGVYLTGGGGGLNGFTGGGGGGSGLGDLLEPGVCGGDGWVTITYQSKPTDQRVAVFEYTGEQRTFVVPEGVDEVGVVACGAQGADGVMIGWSPQRQPGGLGGQASSTLDVTAGETLTIMVGGTGRGLGDPAPEPFSASRPALGGFNGGGDGWFTLPGLFGTGIATKGGGGGASDVRQGGTDLGHRVVIGGGGGGAAIDADAAGLRVVAGGHGGGLEGGDGVGGDPTNPLAGGGGASATTGGQGGWGNPAVGAGTLGHGGDSLGINSGGGGGGGGGGLYGGGAGASNYGLSSGRGGGSGGGGSGLGDSFSPGTCGGDGYIVITYEASPRPEPIAVPGIAVVAEGDSATTVVEVPVRLSMPAPSTVTMDWATHDLSATAPDDYVAGSGTVTIEAGQRVGLALITVNGDELGEGPEAFLVSFHNPVGATVGGLWGFGAGIIVDDDQA